MRFVGAVIWFNALPHLGVERRPRLTRAACIHFDPSHRLRDTRDAG